MTTSNRTSNPSLPEHADTPDEVPPDYDSWYSAIISFLFHFCLYLTLSLIAAVTLQRDQTAPSVAVVQVTDAVATEAAPAGETLATHDSLESAADPTTVPTAAEPVAPVEQLQEVTPLETPQFTDRAEQKATQQLKDQQSQAKRASASAKEALSRALADNLSQGEPGGGGGAGGKGTGRSGRAARWILTFQTRNPNHYLQQMGGLGAEIAFPAQGGKFRYFTNLSATPRSAVRDLSSESRIYWVDENPDSFMPVANLLKVGSPPMMVAFLPVDLEQKMVQLELKFKNAKSEDEIDQTVFKCVDNGGTYDVVVVSQRP